MKKTRKSRSMTEVEESFRAKAEKALRKEPANVDTGEKDLRKIFHELQVHKVELEMINEELIRSKAITENALSKLKLALETGKIGLWEWNLENDELILDENSERIFNIQPGPANYPRKIEDIVSEEDLIHFRRAVNSLILQKIPFETVFRSNASGSFSKFINAKADLIKNDHHQSGILSGVFFDISELQQDSERLIASLNEDLLRSNTDLQNFAYIASHDLQEPLRMITSFTQLLQQQYNDGLDDKAKEYIHFAVEGAKRMYELLNGLLSYSRINTRGQEFREIDMNNILEQVKNNLHMQIEENGVILRSEKLPLITADWNQMIQLFQNLISNSIKFNHGTPEISIKVAHENQYFLFKVQDNGIGIDPRYKEKIFLMFQRLHPLDQFTGIGIGLAICRRIVERHYGKIWVESEIGKGATFIFTIPDNVKRIK